MTNTNAAKNASQTAAALHNGPVTSVPLLDVQRQYQQLRDELAVAVQKVCDSGRFILGPECEELEKLVAEYCQVRHAVACASGSDALLLALMAYDIGPGHEVLLPSYTFFATAGAVARLGAKPVFVDIEPRSFNMDATLIESLITPATKAIIPVHLFGQCADMQAINQVAARHKLPVIEDAAQAIGAEYRSRRAGVLGDVACFSFYPTKNLGGFGDGGMLTTDNTQLAERLRLLRMHGMQPRYYHQVVGINSRLDTLQAAVLKVKLPYLDRWTAMRQANAQRYHEMFAAFSLDRILTLPVAEAGLRHVWNQYIVRVPDGKRDALRKHLADAKVGTEIYYPVPMHEQECFKDLGYKFGSLPESERAARETIALPIFPELTVAEQQMVVGQIAAFFGVKQSTAAPLAGPNFLKRAGARSGGIAG